MWQQPIYDRTKADVSAGADKCYINAALLNRLEGNSAYLAELLGPKIQTKTWTPTDLLTRSEMERILQNIQTLRDAYHTLPGTPALPETPSTLYSDINTMEQVQLLVNRSQPMNKCLHNQLQTRLWRNRQGHVFQIVSPKTTDLDHPRC